MHARKYSNNSAFFFPYLLVGHIVQRVQFALFILKLSEYESSLLSTLYNFTFEMQFI